MSGRSNQATPAFISSLDPIRSTSPSIKRQHTDSSIGTSSDPARSGNPNPLQSKKRPSFFHSRSKSSGTQLNSPPRRSQGPHSRAFSDSGPPYSPMRRTSPPPSNLTMGARSPAATSPLSSPDLDRTQSSTTYLSVRSPTSPRYHSHRSDYRHYSGTVNHCGRHSNDWLFGGFSVRDTVRDGFDRLFHPEDKRQ